ncbi:uncharacterized protein LOC134837318 [Culicoides brevitarsis]|uniref:uncharacterized protein LOC134837318 n=1 Tax=Culicoides brevitarsis TaxID=469753 RepID=UPI00307B8584
MKTLICVLFLTSFLAVLESRVALPNSLIEILSEIPKLFIEDAEIVGCTIDINKDFKFPEPLLMTHHAEGTKRDFLQPLNNSKGLIHLDSNEEFELHCSHGFKETFDGKSLKARCLRGTTFVIENRKMTLKEVSCKRNTFHTTQKAGKCKNNGTLIEIGYEIPSLVPDINNNLEKTFHKLITTCTDIIRDRTFWSHVTLTAANMGKQSGVSRPSFLTGRDHFTSKNLNALYGKNNQIEQLTKLLGTEIAPKILVTEKQFLNRGHLTPKADLIMGTGQRATFYFVNVAPQWASFNSGNWLKIEESVRQLVAERDLIADVYTGTHGVISYRDINGTKQEFYLNYDENGNGLIPVPKIYFKVIVDRKSMKGVALIGVNNPYVTLKEIKRDYIYCDDVSPEIKWVRNIQERPSDGYYYACKVPDLAKVVQTLPELHVTGLLI